ncbi:MAG: TonB-dependent receptor [Magnetococcus sp. YQC-9]
METGPSPMPRIEETVVTATRFPVKRETVPAHVTTLTREQIEESHATSIPDLLRSVAGVHVADFGGNGRYFNVDLRGFGESAAANTLVLVDGRRLNQADLGGVDWLQIPLSRVERIEILRGGSGGVLYGDNASGGVINILTRSGGSASLAEMRVEAGSYGLASSRLAYEGSDRRLSYSLSVGIKNEDGFRDNSDLDARDGGIKLRYQGSEKWAVQLNAGVQHDTARQPGDLAESDFAKGLTRRATTRPDDSARVEDSYVHLTPEIWLSGQDRFTLDLAWRDRALVSDTRSWGFSRHADLTVYSVAPKMRLERSSGAVLDRLTLGLDYQTDEETITDAILLGKMWDTRLEKSTLGGYLHNEVHLSDRWHLTQGVRTDRGHYDFNSDSGPESLKMHKSAWSLGVSHDLNGRDRIFANFSSSFRYPLLDEMYFYFPPGPAQITRLHPQRSTEYQWGWSHLVTPAFRIETSLFRIDTQDEIYYDPMRFSNINLDGTVRRDGVEMQLAKQSEQWALSVHASWTHAEIQDGPQTGKRFPGVPTWKGGASVKYFPTEATTLELIERFVGPRPFISDFANRFGELSGYAVLDATVRHQWSSGIGGWLSITNLLGKEYAEYGVIGIKDFIIGDERVYYPSSGRRFIVGATARF